VGKTGSKGLLGHNKKSKQIFNLLITLSFLSLENFPSQDKKLLLSWLLSFEPHYCKQIHVSNINDVAISVCNYFNFYTYGKWG